MNVKKYIKYTCVGLLLVYTMTSCEKLLNEDPRYSINNVKAFESEATADMALEGCYGYMSTYLTYGQSIAELYVGASGIAWAQTNSNDQDQYNSFDILATNGVVDMVWSGLYKVIGQCNFFIAGVEASSLRDEYKKNAIANAKFLRGLCYYQLASSFGGVPLRLDPTQSSTLSVARAKREDVYALVEQDLKAATEGLKTKEQLGNAADGKATKYAAYALLAKLYYTLASHENNPSSVYWAKAKEAGDIVLANGNYRLEPKFKNLFVNHVAGSPESIFQINFSTSSPSDGNRASWLFSPPNSTNGVSW